MSVDAFKWALSLPLPQPYKAVLTALANHANKQGRAWPSRTLIARESSVSLRTVVYAIKRLEREGLISVEHSVGNSANRYLLRVGEQGHAGDGTPLSPGDGAPRAPSIRTSTVHPMHREDGAPRCTPRHLTVHVASSDGAPGAPKPIRTVKNHHLGPPTTNSRPPRRPKNPTSVPDDFVVTEDMTRWAETLGVPRRDVRSETDQFLDWHRAKGTQFKDWVAAWRTWVRKAVKFRAERQATPPKDDKPWKPGVYSG